MDPTDVTKENRGTCRTVGKDVDFIPDVIRTKRTSAGRVSHGDRRG